MVTMREPFRRHPWRIALGKQYYTWKRRLVWMSKARTYARIRERTLYDFAIAEHRTPLLRKLKDVEMWLQYNKVHNLKLAVQRLDHLVLYPGETFSYWRTIGNPTRGKGYVDGMVLFYGTFRSGVGGGLCQLSNLIYWITLHTPLTVTERHRHSYDVFPDARRTQPFGSGATCAYNYIDLQIRNDTDQPYQLHLYMDEHDLIGQWRTPQPSRYRYVVYEAEHRITQEAWGGYVRHNVIRRKVWDAEGMELDDEYVTENHALMMYSPMLHEGKEGTIGE
jgi:vancomycin resistance protein VanW